MFNSCSQIGANWFTTGTNSADIVNKTLTALRMCLWVLVKMLDPTCVEGAGTPQNTMNLRKTRTDRTETAKIWWAYS